MTVTSQEFVHGLETAFPGAVTAAGDWVEVARSGVRLRFTFRSIPPLRLGILSLARIEVEVSVQAGDATAAQALLTEIDRATQRGGG